MSGDGDLVGIYVEAQWRYLYEIGWRNMDSTIRTLREDPVKFRRARIMVDNLRSIAESGEGEAQVETAPADTRDPETQRRIEEIQRLADQGMPVEEIARVTDTVHWGVVNVLRMKEGGGGSLENPLVRRHGGKPEEGGGGRTMYAERLLPHDIEAEEALIGALLIDGDAMTRIAPELKAGDFFRERNRLCYQGCADLYARGEAIDQVTLARELARTNRIDDAWGAWPT